MTRDQLIERLTDAALADPRVVGLYLGGSLGAGTHDTFSDVDAVLAVEPDHHTAFADGAHAWVAAFTELVLWRRTFPNVPLFMSVMPGWVRMDLTITVPGSLTGSKASLKPLVDPFGLYDDLPEHLPKRALSAAKVSGLIEEFIRVLGLLPLSSGRGEYVVGVTGAGLLRGLLIELMIEARALPTPPGALHLSRVLSEADMAVLTNLPPALPTAESVIAACCACADVFLPRARALAATAGAPWPAVLEAAARDHLKQALAIDLP